MALTKRKLKDKIHTKVGRKIRCPLLKKTILISGDKINGKKFVKDNVYLTLYKDLSIISSIKLSNETRAWYTPTAKSLHHNCQEMRRVLSLWSDSQVELGGPDDWNKARDPSSFYKKFKKINLWMDSVDFALAGGRKVCDVIKKHIRVNAAAPRIIK